MMSIVTAADLGARLLSNLEALGEQTALVADRRRLTGAQCAAEVRSFAYALQALEFAAHARVAVMLPNVAEVVIANVGIWAAGLTYMPVNAMYTGDELLRVLDVAQPAALICTPEVAAALRNNPAGLPGYLSRIIPVGEGNEYNDFLASVKESQLRPSSQECATVAFTSGTTAAPKSVPIAASQIALSEEVLAQRYMVTTDDVILQSLPHFHSNVSLAGAILAWWVGCRAVLMRRYHRDDFVRLVRNESVTVAFGTPTVMFDVVEEPPTDRTAFETLRCFGFGGMQSLPGVRERFEQIADLQTLQSYGMTEAPNTLAVEDPRDERRRGYVGRVLPHVRIFAVAENGDQLDSGVVGELAVAATTSGPYAGRYQPFGGYDRTDTAPPAANIGGPTRSFATGDVGSVDELGRVTLVDRARDMISAGGYKIAPAELEYVIGADPRVAEVYVVGAADARRGAVPVAFVVAEAGAVLEPAEVIDLSRSLAPFKRLAGARIVAAEALPRNALGKVVKRQLDGSSVPRADTPVKQERSA